MLEVLGSDYIGTARAKGLSERDIIYKHALKNALSPVIILAGLQFSAVVSGLYWWKRCDSWPGLGTLALQSILARDTDHSRDSVFLCVGSYYRQSVNRFSPQIYRSAN